MRLLLIGGPADGDIVDVPDPGAGGSIKWSTEDSHIITLYTLVRWAFHGVGWFYLGVHESVAEQERSALAVTAMLRPELVEMLRPIR